MSALSTCERCHTPLERGDLRCAICGTAVPEDTAMAIAEATRPLLERYGGVCLMTDAMLLKH